MATTTPSATLVPIPPVFTSTERLALAGYSGLAVSALRLGPTLGGAAPLQIVYHWIIL
jgi:hypothetical protein